MTRNLDMLERVGHRLGDILGAMTFLGGASVDLLITDPTAPPARLTADVDVITEVTSHAEYAALVGQLRSLGFREDTSEGAPACRWEVEGIRVDVMPTDARILGFSNPWYGEAIAHAVSRTLPSGLALRVVSAPFFLATKLEAFKGRGGGDYLASHDIEDVVALVDGRAELVAEVETAPAPVREYLRREVSAMLASPDFMEALPGHVRPDPSSQERLPTIVDRLRRIARAPVGRSP